MNSIEGIVDKIVFNSEENGFYIFRLIEEGTDEVFTITGTFSFIKPGMNLKICGDLVNTKYGEQIKCTSYEEVLPKTIQGVEKYLGSGLIKGLGKIYAKKIVEHFNDETIYIIEEEPERLIEVSGIGEKRIESIIKSLKDRKEVQNMMIFFQDHGISTAYSLRIIKAYGGSALSKVRDNPYKLFEDIKGIGFHTSDQIASKLGFDKNSIARVIGGIKFILLNGMANGHVFLFKDDLIQETSKLLEVEDTYVENAILKLVISEEIITDGTGVFLPFLKKAEDGIVNKIKELLMNPKFTIKEIDKVISKVVENNKIEYNKEQLSAIKLSLEEKILVITGGPGTGKTTVLKGILEALDELKFTTLLCAPTGRAAKKISDVTGKKGKTIHRLLEYNVSEGFVKNQDNKLNCDYLIVDESSMIDTLLFYKLLLALPEKTTLILIGDVDQLPSVGPGSILKDIITSEIIKVIFLAYIYRQGIGSNIIKNAHDINNGIIPEFSNEKGSDFFFIEDNNRDRIFIKLEKVLLHRLEKVYKLDPIKDVQILVPLKKGVISTRTLNDFLQKILNKNIEYIQVGDRIFKLGDKIMQIKNNYEKNLFNGDIGYILNINKDDSSISVDFDGELKKFDDSELDEIQLAYAITIHKSQGSEYKCVIMPIVRSHFMMLKRNLIYTGITRAKELFILMGDLNSIKAGIKNDSEDIRNTMLRKKLMSLKL